MALTPEAERTLNERLIKLGDMLGDGLGDEPGGGWIKREYRATLKALGIIKPRKRNIDAVDTRMAARVAAVACSSCNGALKQTRSGSMRAKCSGCGSLFQLLKTKRSGH